MSNTARGRLLAQHIADLLTDGNLSQFLQANERPQTVAYPFTARRSRIPKVNLDELGNSRADVTVAALTKAGDEQDRGSELLLYGVSVGVTAYVGESESEKSDNVEDLVEQLQNFLSARFNQCLKLDDFDNLDSTAELELPFVNDPIFNLNHLRESGVYQSITVFQYVIERNRDHEL